MSRRPAIVRLSGPKKTSERAAGERVSQIGAGGGRGEAPAEMRGVIRGAFFVLGWGWRHGVSLGGAFGTGVFC